MISRTESASRTPIVTLNARDARSSTSHRRTAAPKTSHRPQLGAAASAKTVARVSARAAALALAAGGERAGRACTDDPGLRIDPLKRERAPEADRVRIASGPHAAARWRSARPSRAGTRTRTISARWSTRDTPRRGCPARARRHPSAAPSRRPRRRGSTTRARRRRAHRRPSRERCSAPA